MLNGIHATSTRWTTAIPKNIVAQFVLWPRLVTAKSFTWCTRIDIYGDWFRCRCFRRRRRLRHHENKHIFINIFSQHFQCHVVFLYVSCFYFVFLHGLLTFNMCAELSRPAVVRITTTTTATMSMTTTASHKKTQRPRKSLHLEDEEHYFYAKLKNKWSNRAHFFSSYQYLSHSYDIRTKFARHCANHRVLFRWVWLGLVGSYRAILALRFSISYITKQIRENCLPHLAETRPNIFYMINIIVWTLHSTLDVDILLHLPNSAIISCLNYDCNNVCRMAGCNWIPNMLCS